MHCIVNWLSILYLLPLKQEIASSYSLFGFPDDSRDPLSTVGIFLFIFLWEYLLYLIELYGRYLSSESMVNPPLSLFACSPSVFDKLELNCFVSSEPSSPQTSSYVCCATCTKKCIRKHFLVYCYFSVCKG